MENEIQRIEEFVEKHREETLELVKKLASIPAPSHQEAKKAQFVRRWLEEQGAEGVFVDEVCNVQFAYGCQGKEELVVFMAHMDVVFPDLESFQVTETEDKIYAPGVKDDNADLANLLMCIKYLLEFQPEMSVGLLFVANSCEEGLGNLKGSKYIYEMYGERIREMISFDGNLDCIVNHAVGSRRYKISVKTEGGHSYNAFGNANAIYELSRIIQSLYEIQVPGDAKTTYNIGKIEGGTSVNTIAEFAWMLYEFRSEKAEFLDIMRERFESVIRQFQKEGIDITVEILGVRPCGKGVDGEKQREMTLRHKKIIEQFTDRQVQIQSGSTDANVFLSQGIPANVIGTVMGKYTHTRKEWIEKASLIPGQKIGLTSVMYYRQREIM